MSRPEREVRAPSSRLIPALERRGMSQMYPVASRQVFSRAVVSSWRVFAPDAHSVRAPGVAACSAAAYEGRRK